MAGELARERVSVDADMQRGLMVLRLENYVQRAKTAMHLGAELAGLKQLTLVLGLNKSEPEDSFDIFKSIVRKYDDQDREAKQIEYRVKEIEGS